LIEAKPIHPGEHLAEILDDFGISQYRLAKDIHVPPRRINEIVHGKRSITADTALRLGCYFGTSAQFGWTYRATMIWRLPEIRWTWRRYEQSISEESGQNVKSEQCRVDSPRNKRGAAGAIALSIEGVLAALVIDLDIESGW